MLDTILAEYCHMLGPPSFPPVQNNQNWGNNYNPGNLTYRAPTPPPQAALSNELANYMKVNETNMRAMQNQITNMKSELKNEFQATMLQQNNKLENMLSNYFSNEQTFSLHFDLSFTDALLYMPKFASTFKNLLSNKEKLFELAKTPVNENYSAVILKKLPEKLGDLEPIIDKSLPSLTPFEGGDFILEEIEACFVSDSVPPGIDDAEFDPEGDIHLIEEMLNNDTYSPLPPKDLKFEELKTFKSSVDEPPELELKDLPSHLEYAFLEGTNKLPVIIAKNLKDEEKERLMKVLKSHKQAITWKLSDIKGIDPQFCTHKILMEDDFKPAVQHQRRVNSKIHEVIKKEVVKPLDAGLIYPISDSPWVSPVHCVPKKGGMTVVTNEDNELILTSLVTGWHVCIDYRKLNDATRKDHFPLPFMDQMLERLAGNEYYCFLDGFSGYFQIPIDPQDQEKTTFTCPYGTFAYRRMPFGLCNALGTFQRCMMAIFYDMIEETIEVFMDDFSVFGDSFSSCLSHLDKMLKRCEDTNLVLNWEKCHFMVKEGIILGHKISKSGIEVDRAKVDVIAKLPPHTSVKGIRSFLETPFIFLTECREAFETLKKKLTEAPILFAPDWDLPFKIMCDASDFAIGAVLGFARSLAYGASTLWARSRLHEGTGNGYSQKDKNKAKTRQNRAREWKEREKTKPKAYSS
ncbi:reverse transcriptase domain-containing protein [Tanacetum coccineum]|uniref:Reverse transcriptase domain-containing protein n=1 Tax=Tanacetum coccineum TaxID=301880 RepID=A0ABQ5AC84_9ASTR